MREYIKVYCCGDCIHYNWKKHRCSRGATQEGKAQDHFFRDCPLGIRTEDGGDENAAGKDPRQDEPPTESQDERKILDSCIGLLRESADAMKEFLEWAGFDPKEACEPGELSFINKTYFEIVNRLFLESTNHCGGTSTRAKCRELGVDPGKAISYNPWLQESTDGGEA